MLQGRQRPAETPQGLQWIGHHLTVFNPTDGSNRFENLGWPGWLWVMSALNEKGVYMDLHDGTSMGGSVVYADRCSFLNSMFDIMAGRDAQQLQLRVPPVRQPAAELRRGYVGSGQYVHAR